MTREAKKNPRVSFFAWQSSFYDHIIGDDESLNNIRGYIVENPLRWELDVENPDRNLINCNSVEEYYKKIFKGSSIQKAEKV